MMISSLVLEMVYCLPLQCSILTLYLFWLLLGLHRVDIDALNWATSVTTIATRDFIGHFEMLILIAYWWHPEVHRLSL